MNVVGPPVFAMVIGEQRAQTSKRGRKAFPDRFGNRPQFLTRFDASERERAARSVSEQSRSRQQTRLVEDWEMYFPLSHQRNIASRI